MDWKREAIDKLRKYELVKASFSNIPAQISLLDDRAKRLRGPILSDNRVKSSNYGPNDQLLNIIAEKQELEQNLWEANRWLNILNDALAALDLEDRKLLDAFYILPQKNAAENMAEELCYDKRTVYQKKDRALYKFAVALYGRTES